MMTITNPIGPIRQRLAASKLNYTNIPPGTVFPKKLTVQKKIADGGMSSVYLAHDTSQRPVVIKVTNNGEIFHVQALRQEVEVLSLFTSRPISKIFNRFLNRRAPFPDLYDSNVNDEKAFGGLRYVALEYIPGETLNNIIAGHENIPLHKAIEIAMQLCGLQALHEQNYVHRDIKPENIIINNETGAHIIDFGVSCRTGHRDKRDLVVGTPSYMSSELSLARFAAPRSDIYSLGLVLYEMISGDNPMRHDNHQQALNNQQEKPLPKLEITERIRSDKRDEFINTVGELQTLLNDLIGKMTEKQRSKRFKSLKPVETLLLRAHVLALTFKHYEKRIKQSFPHE
ncbi:MAG: serine/threonine-protein kinase [bacterium]